MEKSPFPLHVSLMDDDFYALKWNAALVMRDPRTTVITEAESPKALLETFNKRKKPDIVVVDVEYSSNSLSLETIFSTTQEKVPQATIVCLSQYGEVENIETALEFKVKGFLLKSEVRMAIVPALAAAARGDFVVTPSIARVMENDFFRPGLEDLHVLPVWKPNPRLTPQIIKSFWLRVFFGMRASLAADEMFLETATIERYVNQAYKILTDGWGDEAYLFGVDFTALSPEDQAFVWFTLPPRQDAY